MAVDVILGLQWGDEGKGKIVDLLAEKYHVVCRFQGGPNAGHTIQFGSSKYILHTIPSGVFRKGLINLIGNGVVIDPISLEKEINTLRSDGIELSDNLFISNRSHLILPTHRYLDHASEAAKGKDKIGSTLRGIGPTYMDKTGRNGLRIGDLNSDNFYDKYKVLKEKHLQLLQIYPDTDFDLKVEEERWMDSLKTVKTINFVDGEYFVNNQLANGKNVLAEGAQGSMLDIDYGTYPFVTSSNTITSGVCQGLGVSPHSIKDVIGVTKAYCTRVGSGPFPTELTGDEGKKLRELGKEFGATTGRPRRCGWLDLIQLKYSIMLNGVTKLVITKLDVLDKFDYIRVSECYVDPLTQKEIYAFPFDFTDSNLKPKYKKIKGWNRSIDTNKTNSTLPKESWDYINFLEDQLNVPIEIISIGPGRDQNIYRKNQKSVLQ